MPDKTNKSNAGPLIVGAIAVGALVAAFTLSKAQGKEEGDTVSATISFNHRGPGGVFETGFAIGMGNGEPLQWFMKTVTVDADDQITTYPDNAVSGALVSLPSGSYWAVPVIGLSPNLYPNLANMVLVGSKKENVYKIG